MQNLESRLQRLERQNRTLRAALAVGAILFACLRKRFELHEHNSDSNVVTLSGALGETGQLRFEFRG